MQLIHVKVLDRIRQSPSYPTPRNKKSPAKWKNIMQLNKQVKNVDNIWINNARSQDYNWNIIEKNFTE